MPGASRITLAMLALVMCPRAAQAWVETRLVADDVRVLVERSGMATIDHAVTLRVQGGPLRSFDLPLGDVEAIPETSGIVTKSQGEGLPIPLQVATRPDGTLRVNVEGARGVSHGLYLFHVRYRKNLLSGDAIRREGAMVRLRVRGPAWHEGLDNARCTFVLPASPSEPRVDESRGADDLHDPAFEFISEVKRYPDRDEVELVRPHVARGEAVTWTTRIDPRALAEAKDDRVRPPPPPTPEAERAPGTRIAYALAALFLAIGFSSLVAAKARHTARAAQAIATVRPLLPVAPAVRTLIAGPALVGGVALQMWGEAPWWGTGLVLLAMTTGWYRRPTWLRVPRGPGRWLPLADRDAFSVKVERGRTWLDASTRRGLLTFALALLAVGAAALAALHFAPHAASALLFDSAVLVPIFGTGRARDLPPHPMASSGKTLALIAKRLRQNAALRAIGWARLPDGSSTFDELRLLCSPRVPLRGFTALEVGVVTWTGMGGVIHCPEILIRMVDGSPCHDALVSVLRGARFVRGRKPEERVVTVRPRLPSAAMAAALTARLLSCATERVRPQTVTPAKEGNAATKSGGKLERTAKAATAPSPFHAM